MKNKMPFCNGLIEKIWQPHGACGSLMVGLNMVNFMHYLMWQPHGGSQYGEFHPLFNIISVQ